MSNVYFAYGSNLLATEIARDVPEAKEIGQASLPGYRFEYSKHSLTRGKDAATIRPDPDGVVWGYLYRVDDDGRARLRNREKGYDEILVTTFATDDRKEAVEAFTFQSQKVCERECGPSVDYQQIVARGARSRALPDDYIRHFIEGIPLQPNP